MKASSALGRFVRGGMPSPQAKLKRNGRAAQPSDRFAKRCGSAQKARLISNANSVVGGVVIGMFAAVLETRPARLDERLCGASMVVARDTEGAIDVLVLDGILQDHPVAQLSGQRPLDLLPGRL
jgi:hypothetical protein